jgi:uracil-DNA glycosylase family 4
MAVIDDQLKRVARQQLDTSRLLGVDVIPIRRLVEVDPIDTSNAQPDMPSFRLESSTESSAQARPTVLRDGSVPAKPGRKSGRLASKTQALDDLRARHDSGCLHCTSVTFHRQTVFGEGHADAAVMFIGEAPGEEEDRTGRPFVGRAGQKLNEIIKAMGFARELVYIANVLKSRPPDNRTPLQNEVDACGPFLTEQIRIIQPHVIVALGGPSTKYLLKTETGITRLRGQWGVFEEAGLRVPVMPTFHPAFLLRQYTMENRQKVWSDMQAVLEKLRDLGCE